MATSSCSPVQTERQLKRETFGPMVVQSIPPGADVLTVKQVGAALAVSTDTVYELCRRGDLPHLRVANAIRISREAFRQFVNARDDVGRNPS
ncbi:helix-turn-helix domain-containing protein [Archangium sp.]|uniref:helix-turn-helix domain-containing protein n=1 Tax=Archangium sp. TaxID=1872627 RepID=UPI0039C8B4F9